VGATSTFYVYDPQGSVAQRVDASGNVVSSDLYDAYGSKLAGNPYNDPYGYNAKWGYYTDNELAGLFQTGSAPLVLCGFRYYDPDNGRWLTRDPIGFTGGINLYSDVENNPVNRADPDGTSWKRYGRYCGDGHDGGSGWPPPDPKKPLDKCCKSHDEGWAKVGADLPVEIMCKTFCTNGFGCPTSQCQGVVWADKSLCACAKTVRCGTWEFKCKAAMKGIHELFCYSCP
jgi:RHS repeat-associated protein